MNIPGIHDILMWLVIIALVVLVAMSGMCLNRMYIHRAHRKAIAELHRRLMEESCREEPYHEMERSMSRE